MRGLFSLVVLGLLLGCTEQPPASAPSGQPPEPTPEPKAPKGEEPAPPSAAPSVASATRDVPHECFGGGDPCVPPAPFSQKVCQGKFPSLALVMMEKSSPWQHRFIGDEWLEPINAHGGPSSENWMRFGEEVLLLKGASDYDGKDLKVTGPGDVDVLRADGTCATVAEKALLDRTPGVSKSAPIVWKYLEEPLRDALLKDKQIASAKKSYHADCKGSSPTHPTKPCKHATDQLNQAIMRALKGGIELPVPEKRPEWQVPGEGAAEPPNQAAKND